MRPDQTAAGHRRDPALHVARPDGSTRNPDPANPASLLWQRFSLTSPWAGSGAHRASSAPAPSSPGQGPGIVVRFPIRDGSTVSDPERGEGVVVVVEVAACVGDVGASGQTQGADRQVAEGGERSGRGTCSQLGSILAEGDIPDPSPHFR